MITKGAVRAVLGGIVVATLAALGTSCRSNESPSVAPPGASAADDGGRSSPLDVPQSPIERIIESEIGFSYPELSHAVQLARYDILSSCLSDQGYSIDVASLGPRPETEIAVPYFLADQYLSELASPIPPSTVPPLEYAQDLGYLSAVDSCQAESRRAVVDPIEEISRWLDQQVGEQLSRVHSSKQVVDARAAEAACMDSIGLSDVDAEGYIGGLVEEANLVKMEYTAGAIDDSEARNRLTALSSEEHSTGLQVYECMNGVNLAIADVTATVDESFLSSNAPALQAAIDDMRSAVAVLKDYLG